MMNAWKWAIFGIIVLLIGWGLYSLMSAKNQLKTQISELSGKVADLTKENRDLSDELDYLKSEENLLKLLKEQTSYRLPDEKLIIITSGTTSTQSTSTTTSTK